MYVMDVDRIWFCQYKPTAITWPAPEEFDVQEIVRGEETQKWWDANYPKLEKFWQDLHAYEMPSAPTTLFIPNKRAKREVPALVSLVREGLYGADEDI